MHRLRRLFLSLSLALTAALSLAPLAVPVARAQAETEVEIQFTGQMIELSTTEAPTTIIVRDFEDDADGGWEDVTVEITVETTFGSGQAESTMSDWITGDWVTVEGIRNENTLVVTAEEVVNQSINPFQHQGLNGWVTAIDESGSTMSVQWMGETHLVQVTSNTKMVVPPVNPAALSDFQIGDRVRLRLLTNSSIENEARIIVALRRADHIFLKGRTRQFRAELVSMSGTDIPAELEVQLLANPNLRSGDVNNLIGTEGEHKIVLVDEDTRFVRRFQGDVTLSAFLPGDTLFIVGRANDDGTISARLVRDDEVLATNIDGTHGRIESIDTTTRTIVLHGGRGSGERTVFIPENAEIERNGLPATFADLVLEDRVRVRGTWNTDGTQLTALDLIVWEEGEEDDEAELVEDEELSEIEEDEIERLVREMCASELTMASDDDESESEEGSEDDLDETESEDEDEVEDETEDELEEEDEDGTEDESDDMDDSDEEESEDEDEAEDSDDDQAEDEMDEEDEDDALDELCDELEDLLDDSDDSDEDERDEEELEEELEDLCEDDVADTEELAEACAELESEEENEEEDEHEIEEELEVEEVESES